MPAHEKACRTCHRIVSTDVCDNCGSTDLTSTYSGLVIIPDPESSSVADILKIKKAGSYAIKIG